MELKEIRWVKNDASGHAAFIGSIKVGQYFWNAIDQKNGAYRLNCVLPNTKVAKEYANTPDEAKTTIINAIDCFIKEITK